MSDLTLKRLDAAILKALKIKVGSLTATELGQMTIRCQFSDIRKVALAAVELANDARAGSYNPDRNDRWEGGHDAHADAIRAAVRRLRKEARNA